MKTFHTLNMFKCTHWWLLCSFVWFLDQLLMVNAWLLPLVCPLQPCYQKARQWLLDNIPSVLVFGVCIGVVQVKQRLECLNMFAWNNHIFTFFECNIVSQPQVHVTISHVIGTAQSLWGSFSLVKDLSGIFRDVWDGIICEFSTDVAASYVGSCAMKQVVD